MRRICILYFCLVPLLAAPGFQVRQIPPGGQKIVNITDEKVISVAEAGVDLLNERRGYSDTMLRVSLGEITNGTSEVVAGEMFRLELNVGVSHCLNTFGNIGKTEKDCPILSDSGVYNCWLEVLYRYWDTIQYRLINHTCTPPVEDNQEIQRERKTSRHQLDVTDPNAIHAADVAVNEMNRLKGFSCCTYRDSVASITNAFFEPALDGNSYELVMKIGESFCTNNLNNKNTESSNCPIQPGSEIHVCHVYVTLDSTNQYLKALRDSNCRVEGTTGKPDLVG